MQFISGFTPSIVKRVAKRAVSVLGKKLSPVTTQKNTEDWSISKQEQTFIMEKLRPGLIELENSYGLDLSDWNTLYPK